MRHKTTRQPAGGPEDPYGVPDDAAFIFPWAPIIDPAEAARVVQEFLLEAPYLRDAVPKAIARRVDTDDVLLHFQQARAVKQGGFPFGVVHLTWSGAEEAKMSQQIGFFECWSHWELEGMQRDAADLAERSDAAE